MRARNVCRAAGVIVIAFGAGILLTFFLPVRVLIVIESAVIVAAGLLILTRR